MTVVKHRANAEIPVTPEVMELPSLFKVLGILARLPESCTIIGYEHAPPWSNQRYNTVLIHDASLPEVGVLKPRHILDPVIHVVDDEWELDEVRVTRSENRTS